MNDIQFAADYRLESTVDGQQIVRVRDGATALFLTIEEASDAMSSLAADGDCAEADYYWTIANE